MTFLRKITVLATLLAGAAPAIAQDAPVSPAVAAIANCVIDPAAGNPCPGEVTEVDIDAAAEAIAAASGGALDETRTWIAETLAAAGTAIVSGEAGAAEADIPAETDPAPSEAAPHEPQSEAVAQDATVPVGAALSDDATPQEIVAALESTTDETERAALLARLQEALAAEASGAGQAVEPQTEAEAPTAEEQQERAALAEESTEQALASDALAAVDGSAEAPAAAETETEVVTEETARSSAEDAAPAAVSGAGTIVRSDDDGKDNMLRNILGAAAAGFIVGELLNNGDRVVERRDDRVIVNRDGEYYVLKDENTLLRRPGTEVETANFADGSSRSVFRREDGSEVTTVRGPDGRVVYRARRAPDGSDTVLIDERVGEVPVEVARLPEQRSFAAIDYRADTSPEVLAQALRDSAAAAELERAYSLRQVRENRQLRELMPRVDLDAITFDTGSAAIRPDQARRLATLGSAMADLIAADPGELFLIEGHTDSVGSEISNLALSDRRAESVALALTEYFGVPPENMVTQGYGERYLKYDFQGDIRENRRAAVRRITPLIRTAKY